MHQSFNSLSSNLPLEFDYDAFTPNVTMKYWQASTSLEVVLGATKLWPNVRKLCKSSSCFSENRVLMFFLFLVHSALRVVASYCRY